MAVKKWCVKLSPNKKSILNMRITGRQILYFFTIIFCCLASVTATDTNIACTNTRNVFQRKGMLSVIDLQEQPNSDVGGLCLNMGCCSASARSQLTQQSRTQLEGALRSELTKLASVLANRAKRLDDYFRKLLKESREEFHAMFKRTYGMIYEQHSYVFEQLFEQLERYYNLGDTDFDAMMSGFFGILYQKMFTVLNAQYTFDERFLKCVDEHMPEIQPFDDVPKKLSAQLRRAIVATRTFHKALRSGAEVVRNMIQIGVTDECVNAWARLSFCSSCGGLEVPACSRYCHNVIKGCLPLHSDLRVQWDAYVDAIEKVADRLIGPFNIAMVVEPIDIKISEAIMNFQEHNQEISNKIFASCGGRPSLGGAGPGPSGTFFAPDRSKRFVRSISDFVWTNKENNVDDFEIETSFESLLNDDPSLTGLKSPESIKKITDDLARQAELREKFLQYMRGTIDRDEYEEHERRSKRNVEGDHPADAAAPEIDYRAFEFSEKRNTKKKKPSSKSDDGHDQLVRETRARLRAFREYWSHLPGLLCSSTSVTPPCFNGSDIASYTLNSAGEGSIALASNPEVRGPPPTPGNEVIANTQLETLKMLTAKLKDAYNGVEVQWKDSEELHAQSSSILEFAESAGSGSGSGDDSYDLPDDDEDRGQETGSGYDAPEDDEDQSEPTTRINTNAPVDEPPLTSIISNTGMAAPVDQPPLVPNIINTKTMTPPPVDEPPLIPSIINSPDTNNVNVRSRIGDDNTPVEVELPTDNNQESTRVQDTPVREQPPTQAADRPSLNKALFTYALPVVCAWFGTIVTDLI